MLIVVVWRVFPFRISLTISSWISRNFNYLTIGETHQNPGRFCLLQASPADKAYPQQTFRLPILIKKHCAFPSTRNARVFAAIGIARVTIVTYVSHEKKIGCCERRSKGGLNSITNGMRYKGTPSQTTTLTMEKIRAGKTNFNLLENFFSSWGCEEFIKVFNKSV